MRCNLINRLAPFSISGKNEQQPEHLDEFGLFSRIKRIPTVKVMGNMVKQWGRAYTAKDNDKQSSCCVCLEEFKKGDEIVELHCAKGHMPHPDCIENWAKCNKSCPLCHIGFVELARKEQSSPPVKPEERNDTPPEPYLPIFEGSV